MHSKIELNYLLTKNYNFDIEFSQNKSKHVQTPPNKTLALLCA